MSSIRISKKLNLSFHSSIFSPVFESLALHRQAGIHLPFLAKSTCDAHADASDQIHRTVMMRDHFLAVVQTHDDQIELSFIIYTKRPTTSQ